ncbi:uncharacterized protein LY89DRAFT_743837 [Mollisia scopiformis]|uniref:BZIP domain-containing protein n=1 Tax=Mollisia scopiformis TaxID=149040 RepID=A0A132B2A0_MOLSC|nr:uncharacterized protein LY89DRAFT_743837 [Mollisia scopiformis]KUJ06516.1 hypothetical protein LY89DRAFT_743837 [Mollisia scopiformis]
MKSAHGSRASGPTRRKRIITAARKEQNRIAQQLYRQRQKEGSRLRETQSAHRPARHHLLRPRPLLKSSKSRGKAIDTTEVTTRDTLESNNNLVRDKTPTSRYELDPCLSDPLGVGDATSNGLALSLTTSSCLPFTDWNSLAGPTDYNQPSTQGSFFADEAGSQELTASNLFDFVLTDEDLPQIYNPSSWPVLEDGFLSTASSSNPRTTVRDTCWYLSGWANTSGYTDTRMDLIAHLRNVPGFQDLLSATITFIYQRSISSIHCSVSMPDAYKNFLQCSQTATLLAYFHNARCIGMEVQDLLRHRSLFYCPNASITDDPQMLLDVARKTWMPIHLQPTLEQILIPHHPYLDLLPFPALRARAITLSNTMPKLFDPMELKRDIFKEGLVCLPRGNGTGQPSEMRNWQAAPWFLTKWRLLMA